MSNDCVLKSISEAVLLVYFYLYVKLCDWPFCVEY